MFSSTSFAEWTKVSSNMGEQNTYYVDFEKVQKVDGFVYFWTLSDYLTPIGPPETFSAIIYMQGDCNLFRTKFLSDIYYNGQMGKGERNGGSNVPDKEWTYPSTNSSDEIILKSICSR